MWSGPGCYASYLHLFKSSNFYFPSLKTLTQERKDMHFRNFESLLLGSITALSLWLLENHWSATGQWAYNYVCTLLKVFAFPLQLLASLVAQMVNYLPIMQRPGFDPWVGKIPWRKEWQPTPVFLPGESHGQRNLASYSPWGHKESDMTEWLTLSFSAAIDQ